MIPWEHTMSTLVTSALSTITLPPSAMIFTLYSLPFTWLVSSSVRGIGRRGRVYVDMALRRVRAWRVAVSVGAVVRAFRGDVLAARGLRELPDFGEGDAALRGAWRRLRKCAARCGRAGVIDSPVGNGAAAGVLANVDGGDDVVVVFPGDGRTV